MDNKILVTRSSLPDFDEYVNAIKPLWDSHWITNMGKYHLQLENSLKEKLQVSELSLMVNGHMALEMTLQAFDFPAGSEVITTPFTFISTTHAIVRNSLTPVFCDIKESDGTIDENKIEDLITEKTVAILPVHVYGHVCNVEKIQSIADQYGLKVIYDAAHAFGITYKGRGIGSYGDASVFSFHATKVFNTIEGGAVAFSDHKLYEKLYNLKNFGIHGEELVTEVGANAKMNEFCAIMGLCNLKHFDEYIEARKQRVEYYREKLKSIKGIRLFDIPADQTLNYAYFPLIITDEFRCTRNELSVELREKNIYTRKYFFPITADQACFKNKYKDNELKTARFLSERVLALPLYDTLSRESINRILDSFYEEKRL